jgi:cathepsin L
MLSRLLVLSAAVLVTAHAFALDPFKIDKRWVNYKKTYNKTYPSDSEEARRHTIWRNNSVLITEHNKLFHANKTTFRLGENSYADMTAKEFAEKLNGYHKKTGSHGPWNPTQVDVKDLPAHVDWVKKGYVTPIKNQQQCGSCWAFSATGSMEGAHFKATGKLVSLSEQNLVDCSQAEGNMGCDGGLMDQAFNYTVINKGIDTEASYPYTAMDGTCKFNASNVGATIKSWTDVPTGSEADLQKAVATVGPVSVAIDASQYSFQLYKSGIYNEPACSSQFLDHGVLAVGYGSKKTGTIKDYWLVKNSWGTDWGMEGYIEMSRNNNNNCGIATAASYPVA